ncbi:MAG: outer membrane protein assembly factor BamB [Pseudomonadota bacterium]
MKKIIAGYIAAFGLVVMLLGLNACSTASSKKALQPAALSGFSPQLNVRHVWSRTISKGTSSYYLRLEPVVVKQSVFIPAYDGEIIAVNQKGKRLWKKNYHWDFVTGLAADNGLLFIGTRDGHVLAIQQSNGDVVWAITATDQVLALPKATDGVLLIHAIDGTLTAYSQTDGKQLWQFSQQAPSLMLHLSSQPQVYDKKVICGFADGKLAALDFDQGRQLWLKQIAEPMGQTDIERMVDISTAPLIVDNTAYVVSYEGNLAAVNLKDGAIRWKRKLSAYNKIATDGVNLYATDLNGDVWAFDLKTGMVVWRNQQFKLRQLSGVAVIKSLGVLAFGDYTGYIHFLSLSDGHIVARKRINITSVITTPIVSGDMLYAYTMSGRLTAYRVSKR